MRPQGNQRPLHRPDLPPYRPPSEAGSVLVRVTRGCTWNRCAFCGMYKTLRFELRGLEEIAADIAALGELSPRARSVFLGDSDSLVHPRLPEIVTLARRAFPQAGRITSYSRLTTLRRRPMEWLRDLRAAGLSRIHAGLESGSAPILTHVQKGHSPDQAVRGGCRAMEAGFDLCLYVLSGLGGEEDWENHARETAAAVTAVRPRFLRLRSLVLLPGTPLRTRWEEGGFSPATPITRLRETRLLAELLVNEGGDDPGIPSPPAPKGGPGRGPSPAGKAQRREIEICSDHLSNYVWADERLVYRGIDGFLPSDRGSLCAGIDRAIGAVESAERVMDVGTRALQGEIPSL